METTQASHDPNPEIIRNLRQLNDEMITALILASHIVGKVIADDLMPTIAAKNFPKMTMAHIEAVLRKAEEMGQTVRWEPGTSLASVMKG